MTLRIGYATAAMVAAMAMGCDDERPDPAETPTSGVFRTEADELEYLKRLANPTPEQFVRMKRLDGKLAYEDLMTAKPGGSPVPDPYPPPSSGERGDD